MVLNFLKMNTYVNAIFKRYVPTNKVQYLVLKTMSIPSYKAFEIKSVDPFIFLILGQQRKWSNIPLDRALMNIQNIIFSSMGLMSNMWNILESIMKNTNTLAQIDS